MINTETYIKDVREKLTTLEKERGIKVIYAAVVGSRAYGLDSLTSDCDCKFVYVYPVDRYLNISQPQEFIDVGDDVNGHEVRHFLNMVKKSGFNVMELLYSPHIIMGHDNRGELLSLAHECINKGKLVAAYGGCVHREVSKLSRAQCENNGNGMVKAVVSAGRLYLSGQLVACTDIPYYYPPINFDELISVARTQNLDMSSEVLDTLSEYAEIKRKGEGIRSDDASEMLNLILSKTKVMLEKNKNLPKITQNEEVDRKVNRYFRKTLGLND